MYRTVGFCGTGNLIARGVNHRVSRRLRGRDVWRERSFWWAWVSGWIGGDSGNGLTIGLRWANGDGK